MGTSSFNDLIILPHFLKTYNTNAIEAPESNYLYVDISQLPNSGNGLYTAITIYKDEVIALFKGEILTDLQARLRASKNKDQYFIIMPNGSIMDSMKTKCFAKYANDANNSAINTKSNRNNSKIALDENNKVCLIALRKIKAGEEIFCSYGKKYWLKHG